MCMNTSHPETTDNKATIPAPPPLEGVYGTAFANASESLFMAIGAAANALKDPESWKEINDTSKFNPFEELLKVATAYELACRGVIRAHKPIFDNIPPNDDPNIGSESSQEGANQ